MKTSFSGVVRGRIIELDEDVGLPAGQSVRVTVQPSSAAPSKDENAVRETLRQAAGSWSDNAEELDRYLEWNRQQRKGSRPEVGA